MAPGVSSMDDKLENDNVLKSIVMWEGLLKS